jgi:hypothetical protein
MPRRRFFENGSRSEAPPRVSLRSEIPRVDRDARARERRGAPVLTSDRLEEVGAAGILTELPTFEGSDLLRTARFRAAIMMLRRSGFALDLLPPGAVFQMDQRRRWWRRERSA